MSIQCIHSEIAGCSSRLYKRRFMCQILSYKYQLTCILLWCKFLHVKCQNLLETLSKLHPWWNIAFGGHKPIVGSQNHPTFAKPTFKSYKKLATIWPTLSILVMWRFHVDCRILKRIMGCSPILSSCKRKAWTHNIPNQWESRILEGHSMMVFLWTCPKLYEHLMSKRIVTLMVNKITIRALENYEESAYDLDLDLLIVWY